MLDKTKIEEALKHLGGILDRMEAPHYHVIVCGGSSLIATGLVTRTTTRDVDVLALASPSADGTLSIEELMDLPRPFQEAVDLVARDLGLDKKWLNCSPSSLVRFGLPAGFRERLQSRTYGSMTVYFISRLDQIHFKLYAAADQGPGRHVGDLMDLKPQGEELLSAAQWAMSHDPSPEFRLVLKQMLGAIGHGPIADRI